MFTDGLEITFSYVCIYEQLHLLLYTSRQLNGQLLENIFQNHHSKIVIKTKITQNVVLRFIINLNINLVCRINFPYFCC